MRSVDLGVSGLKFGGRGLWGLKVEEFVGLRVRGPGCRV